MDLYADDCIRSRFLIALSDALRLRLVGVASESLEMGTSNSVRAAEETGSLAAALLAFLESLPSLVSWPV